MFIAACSSFITLLILSLFDKLNYLKHQQTHSPPTRRAYNDEISETKECDPAYSEKVDQEMDNKQDYQIDSALPTAAANEMINVEQYYLHQSVDNYFESQSYLQRIPDNKQWINRRIQLLLPSNTKYSEKQHQSMLNSFDPSLIEPDSNECKPEIIKVIKLFNQLRRWPNDTEWKYRTTKSSMKIYTHPMQGSDIEIVKAEKTFSFPIHIVIATFMKASNWKQIDDAIKKRTELKRTSKSSHVFHMLCKCPWPVSDRDMVSVNFVYPFQDGSVLYGWTGVNESNELTQYGGDCVRGDTTITMYHLRPDYDGNLQHTKVTLYAHAMPNGSIPGFILNIAYSEMADRVLRVERFIKKEMKYNHIKGRLWIIPYPFLEMLGL